jgi:hypothetical protein
MICYKVYPNAPKPTLRNVFLTPGLILSCLDKDYADRYDQ